METAFIGTLILIFIVVFVLFESIVIYLFKIAGFSRALWQSAVVNAVTLLLLIAFWPLLNQLNINEDKVFPFVPLLFGATVIIEGLLLKLFNNSQAVKPILLAVVVMNAVSYGTLLLILSFM